MRPMYLRKIPESVWKRVHINAIESGLHLQTYVAKVLEQSEPLSRGEAAPHRRPE